MTFSAGTQSHKCNLQSADQYLCTAHIVYCIDIPSMETTTAKGVLPWPLPILFRSLQAKSAVEVLPDPGAPPIATRYLQTPSFCRCCLPLPLTCPFVRCTSPHFSGVERLDASLNKRLTWPSKKSSKYLEPEPCKGEAPVEP